MQERSAHARTAAAAGVAAATYAATATAAATPSQTAIPPYAAVQPLGGSAEQSQSAAGTRGDEQAASPHAQPHMKVLWFAQSNECRIMGREPTVIRLEALSEMSRVVLEINENV